MTIKKGMFLLAFFNFFSFAFVITLTKVSDPTLGIVFDGASGRQFILGTNSTVTGTDSGDYISGAAAGNITVTDSTDPLSIEITAINIGSAGGITVNRILASYDGGAETRCDGTGFTETSVASATLLIGIDITTSQIHSGGDTASASFDIEVVYN